MRVKVTLNGMGLVIPVANPKEKVEALVKIIAQRFEGHGIKPGELRIAELLTEDNFEIGLYDQVGEVIGDGERLIALDYDDWIKKNEAFCVNNWLSVIQSDYEDSIYKWIIVGFHTHNKLFVKFGEKWPTVKDAKMKRLEIFDCEALQHFAKDGKVLIGSVGESNENGEWKAEASFIVEGGVVKEVEVSVKSKSDSRPAIKRIGIKVGRTLEKVGEPILVQKSFDDYDASLYTVPSGEHHGPSIVQSSIPAPTIDIENNKSVSIPFFIVKQKGKVFTEQTWASGGKYNVLLDSTFNILNNSSSMIAVTSISNQYKDKDGKWVPLKTYVMNGYRSTDTLSFTIGEKEQLEITVRGVLTIEGKQYDKVRRVPKGYPQPMQIRTIFELSDGNRASIITEQINGPLDVVTKEERLKKLSAEDSNLLWIQCDDTELEGRIFAEVNLPSSKERIEVAIDSSSTKWYSLDALRKIAYEAVKAKSEVFPMEGLSHSDDNGFEKKGFALVDLKRQTVYGMKFELKTSTSSISDYVKIPQLVEEK